MKWEEKWILYASALSVVSADIYVTHPRGSNNRLNGDGRARKNANRLFDSQNNNRGGVNKGLQELVFYRGQTLDISYTQQHSCNSGNAHCDTVIQYMCSRELRDGKNPGTIPLEGDPQREHGMHETHANYAYCKARERNKGLFISTQKLKGSSAKYTRQNNNGNRYGLECPEERDYYPYWGRSPWKDIAILTDYQDCSKLLASLDDYSGYCKVRNQKDLETLGENGPKLPLTKEGCDQFSAVPVKWEAEKNDQRPFCGSPTPSRDNFHGDNGPGTLSKFQWRIPDDFPTNTPCTIRVRYNISTGDYPTTQDSSSSKLRMGPLYGLNGGERGYELRANPQVQIFKDLPLVKNQLNINTGQYGRTFQDRTHSFTVEKPSVGNEIVDLTISGKRGNSLEVYPNMYQSIHPNVLSVPKSGLINLHWTGSDNNPPNSGKGDRKTDLHGLKSSTTCLTEESAYTVSYSNPSTSHKVLTGLKSTCFLKDFQNGANAIPVDALVYQSKGDCSGTGLQAAVHGICEEISEEVLEELFPNAPLSMPEKYFRVNPNTVLNGSSFTQSAGEFSVLSLNGESWTLLHPDDTIEEHSGIVRLRESSTSLLLGLTLSFILFGILLLSAMLFYQRHRKTPWDQALLSPNNES